jgi:hypothetical protein
MTLIEQVEKHFRLLPVEKQTEALDFILFLHGRIQSAPLSAEQEREMQIRTALQMLAELNTFSDISDPVAWQKAVRQDRALPGRTE